MIYTLCEDSGWVCENHPYLSWGERANACKCGSAGEPCPRCNPRRLYF
jgi:hypothetical protein